MSNAEALELARTLIVAFSAGDWPRFRATLAPELAYEETGTGRRAAGADAYVALCRGWREAFPDAAGTIRRAVADGGVVAQEVSWTGTHTGPLAGAGGVVPASGRRIDVPATVWYMVREGHIAAVRHHLDLLAMLQQIGALPPAP
jgi:steroid delta-isomerase-like uncharacterized protein